MLTLPRALKLINSQRRPCAFIYKKKEATTTEGKKNKKDAIAVLLLCISRARKPAAEIRGARNKEEKRQH